MTQKEAKRRATAAKRMKRKPMPKVTPCDYWSNLNYLRKLRTSQLDRIERSRQMKGHPCSIQIDILSEIDQQIAIQQRRERD